MSDQRKASPREMILGGLVLLGLVAVFGGVFLLMSARSEDRALRAAFEERLGRAPMERLGTYGRANSPCQWHAARLADPTPEPPVLGYMARNLTDWQATPVAPAGALQRCEQAWTGTETGARLRAALDAPGAFVASHVFDSGSSQSAIYLPATEEIILVRATSGS
ncbi:hypothetical protein [Nioella sp.]|uniref:hypothetical protein n=1 Tax=Nioella sp. TaxID=1912091 RepID=UPI003A8AE35C